MLELIATKKLQRQAHREDNGRNTDPATSSLQAWMKSFRPTRLQPRREGVAASDQTRLNGEGGITRIRRLCKDRERTPPTRSVSGSYKVRGGAVIKDRLVSKKPSILR